MSSCHRTHSISELKCNPLKSASALAAINPAGPTIKKRAAEAQAAAEKSKKKAKKAAKDIKDLGKKYYKTMVAEE